MHGYTLEYPERWYAELDNEVWKCAIFDPKPFSVSPDTEVAPLAVMIYDEPTVAFDMAMTSLTDTSIYRVIAAVDTTVDGKPAVVLETEATVDEVLAAGTYSYQYVVDRGSSTLVIVTSQQPGLAYERARAVIDEMAASMRFSRFGPGR